MRATLQVVMINLEAAAHQSTPGAPIFDYGPQGSGPLGQFLRPVTEAEAAERRPDFERLSKELRERDPGTYAAWVADFEFWRGGDRSVRIPRVESYALRDADGLLVFRDHRLINTREVVPYLFPEETAFAYQCRRCGLTDHYAGFIGVPRCGTEGGH